ncbi:hypothetical protein HNQ07_001430 [Deinococcus metalli]|uniref:Uncharacterized protein n=1 Tax=Deinococcus metalli TaxID=1141878 RepID=A0A7W8KDY5_9DEIO|nr:winged helix-turn-helix domain-containing protein [Deinococcus metalli]MBB5375973.1 hypothetical protein [Deinococcus metalli]GHF41760.1 hypothetical protein GCM10017781_18110 [Deinococcus metalli]
MPETWQRVTDPASVKLFLDSAMMGTLEHLMLGEHSASSLARTLHAPLNAVHHRVRRLVAAGLAAETRTEPRRGRPIRYYRATSDAYLVPYDATPLTSVEDLVGLHETGFARRFLSAVVAAGRTLVVNERDIGLRVFRDGSTVSVDITPRAGEFTLDEFLAPDSPVLLLNWGELRLTREDAKAMQRELHTLHARYAARSGPERYLFRLGLTRDLQE